MFFPLELHAIMLISIFHADIKKQPMHLFSLMFLSNWEICEKRDCHHMRETLD